MLGSELTSDDADGSAKSCICGSHHAKAIDRTQDSSKPFAWKHSTPSGRITALHPCVPDAKLLERWNLRRRFANVSARSVCTCCPPTKIYFVLIRWRRDPGAPGWSARPAHTLSFGQRSSSRRSFLKSNVKAPKFLTNASKPSKSVQDKNSEAFHRFRQVVAPRPCA